MILEDMRLCCFVCIERTMDRNEGEPEIIQQLLMVWTQLVADNADIYMMETPQAFHNRIIFSGNCYLQDITAGKNLIALSALKASSVVVYGRYQHDQRVPAPRVDSS